MPITPSAAEAMRRAAHHVQQLEERNRGLEERFDGMGRSIAEKQARIEELEKELRLVKECIAEFNLRLMEAGG